ncbi:GGDEF domain-containing protein [Methylobacterium platani]|uniref:diguanylate cyclase n=1 Tax=Methylobacterium platani TaxID=427683 RepID=A0A179SDJ8_9HYPH|nr:GGDEF domain-containing protein [Methylobacterium platani]OAS25514.1 hypothetical protein A5481_09130 [Methylobacterium platani]
MLAARSPGSTDLDPGKRGCAGPRRPAAAATLDEALQRIEAEGLWAEVDAKLKTTGRLLTNSPQLEDICRLILWSENRRIATNWLWGVTLIMWLSIPFDGLVVPDALPAIVAGHAVLTTLALVPALRAWRQPGSDTAQGVTACLFVSIVMLAAVLTGRQAGGTNFERFVMVGFFGMATAVALLPLRVRWTALTVLVLNANFVMCQFINPAVDGAAGVLFTLYFCAISGALVAARAAMNSRQRRSALLWLRETRKTALLKESHDRLHVMAYTDALTGLRNRQAISEDFAGLLRDAPAGEALSVGMIDIDDFKRLNDSRGHAAGDQALRAVGSLLLDFSTAHGAICGRIGGEEFLVLMPRMATEDALARVKTLMETLHRMNVPNPGSRVADRVTLSAGLVTVIAGETEGCHPEFVMRRADVALYDAKNRGRNRVVATTLSPAPGVRELTALVEEAQRRPAAAGNRGCRA